MKSERIHIEMHSKIKVTRMTLKILQEKLIQNNLIRIILMNILTDQEDEDQVNESACKCQ